MNMGDDNLDECYEIVLKLTKEGGKKTVEIKSCEVDLVTETDQEVEKLLIANLKSTFPDHKFIGEESTAAGIKFELTDDPTWIIDPVDGTMNFVHGYPNVCVSVALWVNKEPEIGIIYNPVLEQLFTARRGQGAFMNERQIHVSKETDLSKSLIGYEFGTSRDPEKMKVVLENMKILVPQVHGIRASGSCAMNMALVALGGTDANFEFGIHAWDVAAGALIVTEAGGVCIDPAGGPFDVLSRRYLCTSSQALADQLVSVIKQHYPERD
ncbi:Inositol monophosphatase 1 [Blattella germanica]|nr:Inositol monophosphatase 1 [Blattella germanica]